MQQPVFDVSGAVAVLNQTLDYAFPTITIVGELANYKIAKGRWVYGDIKDDQAKLRLFGSVYAMPGPLSDGMMVEIQARPTIHQQFGFSLNILRVRPVGEGSIKKAADLLKQKLEKEGLFDPSRKRPVPYPPQRVGLVTSAQSAAYADFIKITGARWQGVAIEVYDSQVQGDSAVESLRAGLQYFNEHSAPPDVVVLIRGGGSADDLAAFSAEPLVRAVAASRIPTCVAIGHEIDTSLAELAADVHASTPSNAAELLFPDKTDMLRQLVLQRERIADQVESVLALRRSELVTIQSNLVHLFKSRIAAQRAQLEHASALLESVHPRPTLRRGYALVQTTDGKLVSSVQGLKAGDALSVSLQDGILQARVEE